MQALVMTVCYVIKSGQILLGYKKQGDRGQGLYNGFGGKVKGKETIEQAAARELEEESGLKAISLEKCGIVEVTFESGSQPVELHLFSANKICGQVRETDEMKPKWFESDNIPFNQMWPTDKYFFPCLSGGQKFIAHFHLNNIDEKKILNFKLIEKQFLPEKVDWESYRR